MENTFLPSLATNCTDKQIALIINSNDTTFKKLLKSNIFAKTIPDTTLKKFFNVSNYEKLNDRLNNKYDRIAYIPFGMPSIFIEGILVGRQLEKNKKILKTIKTIFPNCYISNLDGIIIE